MRLQITNVNDRMNAASAFWFDVDTLSLSLRR